MKHRNMIRQLIHNLYFLDGLYMQISREVDCSENVVTLFYALDDGGMHTQKAISEQWGIPRTTLNTIVKKYELEDYIKLEHVPNTRREMNLILTKKGKDYADKLLNPIYQVEEKALQATLKEVSADFIAHFELFTKNMEKALYQKTERKKTDD